MAADGPLGKTQADFERGMALGARLAGSCSPVPHLRGGAYAVGLLFGYRAALRRRPHGRISTHPADDR